MSYAIIGLLSVLVIAFGILSAKNWHWVNIVFLILTYIMGVTASIGLAQSLKLRHSAMKDLKQAETRLARLEEEASIAIQGPLDSTEFGEGSLRQISEELDRELLGQGRLWKFGTVEKQDPNRIFKFASTRPDDALPMNGMIVYAFADGTSQDGIPYPFAYIGTYRVISETAQQLELEPIFVASTALANNVENATWSLFEKMPVDRRDAFKVVEGITEDNFDIDGYRQIVTSRLPAETLGFNMQDRDSQLAYEKLIDTFTFDGLPFGTIANYTEEKYRNNQRLTESFEAKPEETFIRFKFNKKTGEEFEVDATANLTEDGNFTNQGLASNPALQHGGKIGFDEGDTVLIDELSAEDFEKTYPVDRVDRIYHRPLKNYPYLLENLQRETIKMAAEQARVKTDITVTESALNDALEQERERNDIKNKLAADVEKFQVDNDSITSLLDRRTTQLDDCESRIRELKGKLDILYRQLNARVSLKP